MELPDDRIIETHTKIVQTIDAHPLKDDPRFKVALEEIRQLAIDGAADHAFIRAGMQEILRRHK